MSNLAAYRTAVLALLCDASAQIFSNNDVDQALRWALSEYSVRRPLIRTYQFSVDDTTSTFLLPADFITHHITKVELYDEDPDQIADLPFVASYIDEQWVIHSLDYEIAAGGVLTIYYSDVHTIDDLDSSAGTTVLAVDETLLQTGAAGHAAQMHALSKVETLNLNDGVIKLYEELAAKYLSSFRTYLTKEDGVSVAAITFPDINMVF